MDENFKWRATAKTGEQLHNCIDNREKFLPETVEAAVAELQHRGVEFSDEELRVIDEDMQARRALANTSSDYNSLFSAWNKNNHVDDPEAPAFYSKRAIYAFAIVFSVIFASIMMAVNISKTDKKIYVLWVLLYGLAFTTAEIIFAENYYYSTGFTIIAGTIGVFPLNYFFWDKAIGRTTLYRVKPIWIPLAIGIVILTAFTILILNMPK